MQKKGSRVLRRSTKGYLSLTLITLALACTAQKPNTDEKTSEPSSIDKTKLPNGYIPAESSVQSFSYQAASHSLYLQLNYSGCKSTVHRLLIGESCAESYPRQCRAELIRPQGDLGACDALQSEELVHPLPADFDAAYLSLYRPGAEPLSVLVDKTGQVADQVTPPLEESEAGLKAVSYEKDRHQLKIILSYSGCTEAKHSLKISEVCALSYPKQCSAQLMREGGFDSSCKKLIEEELILPLDASMDGAVLTIRSKSGASQQVLIDRSGAVKNMPQP